MEARYHRQCLHCQLLGGLLVRVAVAAAYLCGAAEVLSSRELLQTLQQGQGLAAATTQVQRDIPKWVYRGRNTTIQNTT